MAALRAAKKALRSEIKGRVAALSDAEKRRQSRVVSQQVRGRKRRTLRRLDPPRRAMEATCNSELVLVLLFSTPGSHERAAVVVRQQAVWMYTEKVPPCTMTV